MHLTHTDALADALSVATDERNQQDPRANEALDALSFFIGEWKLATRFERPNADPVKATGRLTARYGIGGFGIILEEVHAAGPNVFVDHIAYTIARDGTIVAVGINTIGNRKSRTAAWQGENLIVTESGDLFAAAPGINRMTYSDITPTSFKLNLERSTDDGQTWSDAGYSFTATRVAN